MKQKWKAALIAARAAKYPDGKPEVSKYASKGGSIRYDFKEREAKRLQHNGLRGLR